MKRKALCVDCGQKKEEKDMAYWWNYHPDPEGLCHTCNEKYGVMDEVEKLLLTRYKDWDTPGFKTYFKAWNHLFEPWELEGEPRIDFVKCLFWEQKLYFRNVIIDVQMALARFEGKRTTDFVKVIALIDSEIERHKDINTDHCQNEYYGGYKDCLDSLKEDIIKLMVGENV